MYIISYLVYNTQQVTGVNRSWLIARKSVSSLILIFFFKKLSITECSNVPLNRKIGYYYFCRTVAFWKFMRRVMFLFSAQSFKMFKRCNIFQQLCWWQGHYSYIVAYSQESSCSLIFEECCPLFFKLFQLKL